jgi:hypothetical protein
MPNQALEELIIGHLKSYRTNPLTSGVFDGSSSFKMQVEQFYDRMNKQSDLSIKGKNPKDLIEIVAPLSIETLNKDLLQYDIVREGRRKDSKYFLIHLLIGFGLAGLGTYVAAENQENVLGGMGLLSAFAGAVVLAIVPDRSGYTSASREYENLKMAAGRADEYVKKIRESIEANL